MFAGLSEDAVANVTVLFGAGLSLGSAVSGIFIDQATLVGRKKLLSAAYGGILAMVGMLLLPLDSALGINSGSRATMWFALYGSICGIQFVTNGILLADIFGRKALGSINGMAIAVSTASSGLGPLMFGACKDYMGSYRPMLSV